MMGVWPSEEPLRLHIPGTPVPWANAAHNPKSGGRFIPSRQARHAARIMEQWEASGERRVEKPHGVVLGCDFIVIRPGGQWWRGGVRGGPLVLRPDALAGPTGRPDLSNMLKLVEDALTTLAWEDDDQIVEYEQVRKFYGRQDATIVRLWRAPSLERNVSPIQSVFADLA